jgi:hypothetical protein
LVQLDTRTGTRLTGTPPAPTSSRIVAGPAGTVLMVQLGPLAGGTDQQQGHRRLGRTAAAVVQLGTGVSTKSASSPPTAPISSRVAAGPAGRRGTGGAAGHGRQHQAGQRAGGADQQQDRRRPGRSAVAVVRSRCGPAPPRPARRR